MLALDGAGWRASPRLERPDNIALLPLPAYAPELKSMDRISGSSLPRPQPRPRHRPFGFHHGMPDSAYAMTRDRADPS